MIKEIKETWLIFTFVCTIGLIVICQLLDRVVYRERLAIKDSLISDYKEKLAILEGKVKATADRSP